MKKVWLAIPIAASAIALLAAAAPDKSAPIVSPSKLGLWVFEKHSNIPLFIVALPKSPAEAASRSQEMLARPGLKREFCISEELRQKMMAQPPMAAGCTVPPPVMGIGTATVDGTCDGKIIHAVMSFGPSDHVLSAVHSTLTDPAGPERGAAMDAVYDTSEHFAITVVLARQDAGVHMTEVWDFRWVSADCGALKPGESRPVVK